MSINQSLQQRCNDQCELCASKTDLYSYELPHSNNHSDCELALCNICLTDLTKESDYNLKHWHCLNDSMWSQVPAVQVCAWRMLKKLDSESWARDLLDMLYLDDELSEWAKASQHEDDDTAPTKDSNGATLQAGDSVVIIKDLDVKGTRFVAKRGTTVRNIALTTNPEHIEGRVNGTRIVILTQVVKKSS